jgi:hypothetical protein
MAFRSLSRGLFQLVTNRRLHSSISKQIFTRKSIVNNQRFIPFRSFSSVQTNDDAYGDLSKFLDKEIQLEKSAQKHPSKLPKITGFEVNAFSRSSSGSRVSEGTEITFLSNVN